MQNESINERQIRTSLIDALFCCESHFAFIIHLADVLICGIHLAYKSSVYIWKLAFYLKKWIAVCIHVYIYLAACEVYPRILHRACPRRRTWGSSPPRRPQGASISATSFSSCTRAPWTASTCAPPSPLKCTLIVPRNIQGAKDIPEVEDQYTCKPKFIANNWCPVLCFTLYPFICCVSSKDYNSTLLVLECQN